MKILGCWWVSWLAVSAVQAADPDLGPNVLVFDPAQHGMQERIDAVFHKQERAQFGPGRYALLFKPGRYALDVPVGFFTHVAGLGNIPADVTVAGRIWTDAAWMKRNATCNFWRTVENITVEPAGGVNVWAVSQAAPMRRTHIRGDLHLSSGGWSSGGFMADCKVDGTVKAGSQQQWLSRSSEWKEWQGVNWNMVFAGCANPPPGQWPERAVTRIEPLPLAREKPYLMVENGQWFVKVPPLRREASSGLTWGNGDAPGEAVPIERFHVARAGADTAQSINAALRSGKHLLITPGIYSLDETIVITKPNTVVFGLGLPSLVPITGQTALRIESSEGVIVSGLVFDAGPAETDTMVQFGLPGRKAGRAGNPIGVWDLVCRVGGYGPGKAKRMVAIHDSHVLGDNLWLWRADHGSNVGWAENTCDTGLQVDGDDVTIYGLFVEHTQAYQTVWNGERGRVYFYQSEMPYDPPSHEEWRSPTGEGYASYKVGDRVTHHEAWGLGVYHVFKRAPVLARTAIETPAAPGIRMHHMLTFRLGGGRPGSGIRHVINDAGGEVITSQKATVTLFTGACASQRLLFLDPSAVRDARGIVFAVNPPRESRPVMRVDRPWEAFMMSLYTTVLEEDGLLRMWYICRDARNQPNVAYAESVNGLDWIKPNLDIVEYGGSKANNLVGLNHLNGSVFKDPNAMPAERYVYVADAETKGVFRFTSPDGLRWKRDEKPFLPFRADTQNVVTWDEKTGRYGVYLRAWRLAESWDDRLRCVARLELPTLAQPAGIRPSGRGADPVHAGGLPRIVDEIPIVLAADDADPPGTDVYNISAQRYPLDPRWFVGFPSFMRRDKNISDGRLEVQFVGSRDGVTWHRYDRAPFVRPGLAGSLNANMAFVGPGIVVRGEELWLFGAGFKYRHGDLASRRQSPDGAIYRHVTRVDGFVALDFMADGGGCTTEPLAIRGSRLVLNLDTGGLGEMRVGLMDAATGEAIPGFGLTECVPLRINSNRGIVRWKGKDDVSALAGRVVRLNLAGLRAKVYSAYCE
ncbi:MAG TPA: hypothetical protein P5555_07435 [Candidatus Paceibacterota bacterium]|nr:hypothetical protein [Verrucomicrobiota bacterium]HRZ45009.1 hypothetical protein [Candidatus Paceibacterota bacterium]